MKRSLLLLAPLLCVAVVLTPVTAAPAAKAPAEEARKKADDARKAAEKAMKAAADAQRKARDAQRKADIERHRLEAMLKAEATRKADAARREAEKAARTAAEAQKKALEAKRRADAEKRKVQAAARGKTARKPGAHPPAGRPRVVARGPVALRVDTRGPAAAIGDAGQAGQLAIARLQALAARTRNPELAMRSLTRVARSAAEPSVRRAALFAISDLYARQKKLKEAAEALVRVTTVPDGPAGPRVPRLMRRPQPRPNPDQIREHWARRMAERRSTAERHRPGGPGPGHDRPASPGEVEEARDIARWLREHPDAARRIFQSLHGRRAEEPEHRRRDQEREPDLERHARELVEQTRKLHDREYQLERREQEMDKRESELNERERQLERHERERRKHDEKRDDKERDD